VNEPGGLRPGEGGRRPGEGGRRPGEGGRRPHFWPNRPSAEPAAAQGSFWQRAAAWGPGPQRAFKKLRNLEIKISAFAVDSGAPHYRSCWSLEVHSNGVRAAALKHDHDASAGRRLLEAGVGLEALE